MNDLSKFADTLKELMILKGLNEKGLADNSGVPISCISNYLRGLQSPYADTLIKLADYFQCPIDYLLGRTDKTEMTYKTAVPFSQRFNELLKLKDCKSFKKSFKDMEISKTSFYEWKRGDGLPTLEKIVRLADFFGCSVDFLLGRES